MRHLGTTIMLVALFTKMHPTWHWSPYDAIDASNGRRHMKAWLEGKWLALGYNGTDTCVATGSDEEALVMWDLVNS